MISAITSSVVSVVVVMLSVVVVMLSVVEVVVEEPLSLLLLQEMTVRLKRNMEKMMSTSLIRLISHHYCRIRQ